MGHYAGCSSWPPKRHVRTLPPWFCTTFPVNLLARNRVVATKRLQCYRSRMFHAHCVHLDGACKVLDQLLSSLVAGGYGMLEATLLISAKIPTFPRGPVEFVC